MRTGLTLGNPGMAFGLSPAANAGVDLAAAFADLPKHVLFDESTAANMTVGTDGSGGAPGEDDPIGRILDQSGNGRHAVAPADASRALYSDGTNGLLPTYDGVDDKYSIDISGIADRSDLSIIMLIDTSDTKGIVIKADGSNSFTGCFNDGSGSGISSGITPTVYVNGVDSTASRDVLHDALSVGSPVIFEVRGADMSAGFWDSFSTSAYSAFEVAGRISHIAIMDSDDYDAARSSVILPRYAQIGGVPL